MNNLTTRNPQIDILKGVGIFCVVLGHCQDINKIGDFIFMFHMPLFFFCSGYLMISVPKQNFSTYFKKKFKDIIVPYTIFFLISLLFGYLFIKPIDTIEILDWTFNPLMWLEAFVLSGRYLYNIPIMNFALWYLPLYFITIMIFYWIRKFFFKDTRKNKIIIPIIIIILFFITQPINSLLNHNDIYSKVAFSAQVICPALFFMLIGSQFNLYITQEKYKKLFCKSYFVPIFFICGIIINRLQPSQILFATKPFMLGAILIIFSLYILTINSSNKILAYIGGNSLLIYGLHRPLLYFLENSKISYTLSTLKINDIYQNVIYTIFIISIIVLLDLGLKKLNTKRLTYKLPIKKLS